jgi:hypothetical protein
MGAILPLRPLSRLRERDGVRVSRTAPAAYSLNPYSFHRRLTSSMSSLWGMTMGG